MGAGVLKGVFFLIDAFFPSLELSSGLLPAVENPSGRAGTRGIFPRFACRRGMTCVRFERDLTGTCCTMLGEVDDHEMGVVVVVDSLQGLLVLEVQVDGLLREPAELFSGSWYLVGEAASACNSGINRGGKFVGLFVLAVLGMTIPKIASFSVSNEDTAVLFEVSADLGVHAKGRP